MKETISQVGQWLENGETIAIATLIRVSGSTPRPLGARMVITESGKFSGSVSGGCVENAVIQHTEEILRNKQPQLVHFGITDEMSWEVGLACGGSIDVMIQPARSSTWTSLHRFQTQNIPGVLITVIEESSIQFGFELVLSSNELPIGLTLPRRPMTMILPMAVKGLNAQQNVLVEPLLSRAKMIIFGGIHAAIPLTRMAHLLDYQVIIIDPRRRFANPERFPDADRILVEWPDKAMAQINVDTESAIVILTHDPKIDEPALIAALATEAFYIGAIGSRKTHADRYKRLAQLKKQQLDRVFAPIGLDLGGNNPSELALSILSEITAVRNKGKGGFLTQTGPNRVTPPVGNS